MKQYNIYIKSNEHPRTINTPKMGRTYFTKIAVFGRKALESKVAELHSSGEHISEICTTLGTRIWL